MYYVNLKTNTKRTGKLESHRLQVPVLRESLSDGHRRLSGDIVPLLRRLPARPHSRLLLRRLQVETQDWIQRQGRPLPLFYRVQYSSQRLQHTTMHRIRFHGGFPDEPGSSGRSPILVPEENQRGN